jgi:hypothetical protein
MTESYLNLKRKYDALLAEHSKLKNEYSENFMIQSMNDMKKMYEEKENSLKISEKKNRKLYTISYHLSDCIKTGNIMLETVIKNVQELEKSTNNRVELFEIELKLKFIQEILEEAVQTKNELLYFSSDN